MNFRAISAWKPAGLPIVHNSNETSGVQPFGSPVSRRAFARTVAGTAAVGTALGSDAFESHVPRRIAFPWSFAPVPIPKGTLGLGGAYHVFGPGTGANSDPVDAEPSSITNFKGFVGLAYISGNVTQTNSGLAGKTFFHSLIQTCGLCRGRSLERTERSTRRLSPVFESMSICPVRANKSMTSTRLHSLQLVCSGRSRFL
jgi:hypothetical protein